MHIYTKWGSERRFSDATGNYQILEEVFANASEGRHTACQEIRFPLRIGTRSVRRHFSVRYVQRRIQTIPHRVERGL